MTRRPTPLLRGTAISTAGFLRDQNFDAAHSDPRLITTTATTTVVDDGESSAASSLLSVLPAEVGEWNNPLQESSRSARDDDAVSSSLFESEASSLVTAQTSGITPSPQAPPPLIPAISIPRRELTEQQTDPNLPTQQQYEPKSTHKVCNSQPFQAAFASLLVAIVVVRGILFFFLVRHRKQGSIQLAQPSVLAVLIVAGSVSIGSCFFLIHTCSSSSEEEGGGGWTSQQQPPPPHVGTLFCQLRDPMILTPLTLAGCILLGRVWRIVLLLTSVLQVKDDDTSSWGESLQRHIMHSLTALADSYNTCQHSWNYHVDVLCRRQEDRRHISKKQARRSHATASALRKHIPLVQLAWLIVLLLLPQLVLQICKWTIPSMNERLEIQTQYETWGEEERWTCQTNVGRWPTYLGIVLMIMPYLATAILAWNAADDLPKVFDEAHATSRSFKTLALVVITVVPPLFLSQSQQHPDATVYLISMLVFALAMPPCWFIVYPKVWQALNEDSRDRVAIRRLLLRKTEHTETSYHHHPGGSNQSSDTNGKSAKLALTIGKMYEDMGMHSKSLTLFDDALAVWQVDPARENKEQIGGFTKDEIDSFRVSDLECIVHLLIAKGRVHGTFNGQDKSGQKNAAQAWLDALEVYELAPARASMKDRSMLFPVFSGLFVFLKGGKIGDDSKSTFEQNLAKKFVRESKLQGDPVHYTRALAMHCEVKARLGKYKVALESFHTLKEIYDPEDHSEKISEAYGTDRSAQAFSQCALWHMEMGNTEMALEACNYVLNEIMFLMDPKNVLNMCDMMLPIIRIYKPRGEAKRMRDLFQKYVIQNHEKHFVKHEKSSPCSPVFKPLMMLLDICHDPDSFPDFEDAVEWLMQQENGIVPDFLDSIYTKLCWSPHSMSAELCLIVAKRLVAQHGDASDTESIVLKGIHLCGKTEKKVKDKDGHVILPISNAMHQPVYEELKELAQTLKIEYITGLDEHNSNGLTSKGSHVDLKNLPRAYTKRQKSSDGCSSSNQSPLLSVTRTSLVSFASGADGSRSAASDASTLEEFGSDVVHTRRKSGLVSRVSELSLDLTSHIESCIDEAEESVPTEDADAPISF